MTEVRVVNSSGDPAVCYRCDKSATAFINTSITMASSVPSHMEPVCAEHDPYKTRDITLVPQAEWGRLQAQLAAQAEVIEAARFMDSCLLLDGACDHSRTLVAALARLDAAEVPSQEGIPAELAGCDCPSWQPGGYVHDRNCRSMEARQQAAEVKRDG